MKKIYTIFGILLFLYVVGSISEPNKKSKASIQEPTQILTDTGTRLASTTASSESTSALDVDVRKITPTIPDDGGAQPKYKDKPLPKLTTKKVLYVSGSIVNLRAKATTNSRIVSKLARGTKVYMNGSKSGKWIPIAVDKSDVIGWMYGDFLKETKPVINATPKQTTKKRSIATPTSREIREARKAIIRQSIRSYPGSCPCPYNRDRAGRKCGGRSAWSRPGGYSPSCYASDVTDARLKTYFKRTKGISY